MKTSLLIFLLCIASLVYAETSLYDLLKTNFGAGELPDMDSFSSIKGEVRSGRCVLSGSPNKIYAAYFVANTLEKDPFVRYVADLQIRKGVDPNFYDKIDISSRLVESTRAPLILQNEQRAYRFEDDFRHLYTLRSYKGVLMGSIQVFQQDTEILCYFSNP
ncbi:MAG: hypothetical protein ACK5Y2_04675 [Bdellovibrionales bacterium]